VECAEGSNLYACRTARKQFFFEKKNQKTFTFLAYVAGENRDSDLKVFCFFSSEKKTFLDPDSKRRAHAQFGT
jgi:hypothetical protein